MCNNNMNRYLNSNSSEVMDISGNVVVIKFLIQNPQRIKNQKHNCTTIFNY